VQAPSAIEARELTRKFGGFTAVDAISFTVAKGSILGLLGANGAGKSTTIRMLCGLLRSSSGTALVAGYDINTQPELIKQNIGYMSQRFSLYLDLTVRENIRFFAGIYGLTKGLAEERLDWVLDLAGLAGREEQLTGELAGGWRQRLALGCAILHRPPIVFLDEPTAGVDPLSRRDFWGLINRLAEGGTTVLVTTHYLDEAEYANRLLLIHAGRIVAEGSPGELKHQVQTATGEAPGGAPGSPTLEEAFVRLIERQAGETGPGEAVR
jgi:ABC-2 type transport system ATP-binding protein